MEGKNVKKAQSDQKWRTRVLKKAQSERKWRAGVLRKHRVTGSGGQEC